MDPIIITNGHTLKIGGILLTAVIEESAGTVRIEERGKCLNGEAQAVLEGRVMLAARMKRTRPDLVVLGG